MREESIEALYREFQRRLLECVRLRDAYMKAVDELDASPDHVSARNSREAYTMLWRRLSDAVAALGRDFPVTIIGMMQP
jgi:hypothetical protein